LQLFLKEVENLSDNQRVAILDFGSLRKVTTLSRDHVRNISDKFHKILFSRFWEEVQNVKSLCHTMDKCWSEKLTWAFGSWSGELIKV